ncbi:hypothetical protein PGT21_012746 [Puccinia graminis f. sp. tritici]|uniref:Uncharacterized protein n=1 Tax=Puccinia graminis f. sp. tritici TaxID=56615 RepID=A0A5B0NCB8_PUCGR|nr:hypothetical protein PGTUg99_027666 [Puccinia graminis f. sp. tritici]KAA1085608.1 hypothetical protein PGT21_012746 [Puccinia graminis f. sp. tritici]KAA1136019.1 hypothetical protein PGTUg99_022006 [Puccinia graminis f. sp. tritici]
MRLPLALAYILFTAFPIVKSITSRPEIRHGAKAWSRNGAEPFYQYDSQPTTHTVGENSYITDCLVRNTGRVEVNNPFPVLCHAQVIQYPTKRGPPSVGNMITLEHQNTNVEIQLTYLKPEDGSTENHFVVIYHFNPDDYKLLERLRKA